MQRLLKGILQFRSHVFQTKRDLFEQLAKGQSPEVMFITCADSRICPTLITQSDPGDLFVVRNAGNIIPPAHVATGESATIEYAIEVLKVKHIVVCGHSHCGAMAGILEHGNKVPGMPYLSDWLRHALHARDIVLGTYHHFSPAERLNAMIEANVLQQIENLCSLPSVIKALAEDRLDIHGWVYQIDQGEILSFDLDQEKFRPINELLNQNPSLLPLNASLKSGLQQFINPVKLAE